MKRRGFIATTVGAGCAPAAGSKLEMLPMGEWIRRGWAIDSPTAAVNRPAFLSPPFLSPGVTFEWTPEDVDKLRAFLGVKERA